MGVENKATGDKKINDNPAKYPGQASVKNRHYFGPKWSKSMPIFRPKQLKNHTLWGLTHLNSPYKGASVPGVNGTTTRTIPFSTRG